MIIIPMVGNSSRFFNDGYSVPKYQLPIDGETVFSKSVRSFEKYFDSEEFIFCIRTWYSTYEFVEREITKLGISKYKIIEYDKVSRGQADTVYQAIKTLDILDQELIVFNIDTFRPGYCKPNYLGSVTGYLEVFIGEGEQWSFVLPGDDCLVKRTTEKERISNLCSNGLYYFNSCALFNEAFRKMESEYLKTGKELYIAPMYNYLISQGTTVRYELVERNEIIFCGTPDEYVAITN